MYLVILWGGCSGGVEVYGMSYRVVVVPPIGYLVGIAVLVVGILCGI